VGAGRLGGPAGLIKYVPLVSLPYHNPGTPELTAGCIHTKLIQAERRPRLCTRGGTDGIASRPRRGAGALTA